ncbi:MAG: type IV secretion system DNA-binding domain-containing protein [Gammaproteobacteria bacterium SHHR-1]
MSSQTLPPTDRTNPWVHIALIAGATFLLVAGFLLVVTWSWFGDSYWSKFSFFQHASLWREGLWGMLGNHASGARFQQYISVIRQQGYEVDLVLHLGLPLMAGLGSGVAAAGLLYQPGGTDSLHQVSGPVLYRGKLGLKQAKALARAECSTDPIGPGISIYPGISLSKRRETENLLFLGMPGSGKSQLIQPIICQVIERGDRCLIYDEKKEYTEKFYSKQKALLIAPWDRRSAQWDIAADCRTEADAKLIAARTIPVSDKEPLWGQGARLILVGGILHCIRYQGRHWGWQELAEFLALPEAAMTQALQAAYPLAAKFVQEGSKTTQSLLMTVASSLSWVDDLAKAWPEAWSAKLKFSIRHWVRNEKTRYRTLILQNDPDNQSLAESLINALISLATSSLLNLPDSQHRSVWLFLDELGNLPKNPSLLKWLSLARSKGGRMVIGIQDLAMIQEVYGKNILDAKASMIGTVIALRVAGTGDTASWVSKALGEREVERPQITSQSDGSTSNSWQHQVLPVVRAADLTGLPKASPANGIQGFLAVGGWNAVHCLTWPLKPLPRIAKAFVPKRAGLVHESHRKPVQKASHTNPLPAKQAQAGKDRAKEPMPTASRTGTCDLGVVDSGAKTGVAEENFALPRDKQAGSQRRAIRRHRSEEIEAE